MVHFYLINSFEQILYIEYVHFQSMRTTLHHITSHHITSYYIISVLLITVGRKFSGIPLERALCCRLQDFRLNQVEEKKKAMKTYLDKKMRSEEEGQTLTKRVEKDEEEGGEVKGEIVVVVEKKVGEEGMKQIKKEHGLEKKEEKKEGEKERAKKNEEEEEGGGEIEVEIVRQRRTLYSIHHPVMMCTSIKLDNSAIITGSIEKKVSSNHMNMGKSDNYNISDDHDDDKINNSISNNNKNSSDDSRDENKLGSSNNPISDGAVFSQVKCFCWWLENTDFLDPDFSLYENDHNHQNCNDIDSRIEINEKEDANADNVKQKRKPIGVKRKKFVIIDSREGLGLKQDYFDDKNDLSDCIDYEKNSNSNGNDITNDKYDNDDSHYKDNYHDNIEISRGKNGNICSLEIIENTNLEISEISSFALFTDFKNIVNCLMKYENNETVQNYQKGTYANNKNKSFLFLNDNEVSFRMYSNSDDNTGNCHDIHGNCHDQNIRSVHHFRDRRLFSNPYSEAKRILFTDTRFFQDWVRKRDFILI